MESVHQREAERLVNMFHHYDAVKMSDYTNIEYPSAIAFAKFMVDEIIFVIKNECCVVDGHPLNYYEEVKQELDNL